MARPQTLYRAPKGATLLEGPRLTAAEISAGAKQPALREAGRMLDCTATMAAEPTIRKEWVETSCSAAEVSRTYQDKEIQLSCSLRSAADVQNILMAWQGKSKVETGGTAITDEPTPADIAAGDAYMLNQRSDGAATIADSAAGNAIEGTNWEWLNGSSQVIRILDVTSLTTPLLVSYNTAASTEVGLMNDMGAGRHIVVQATNAENSCSDEIMELYNVIPDGDFADTLGIAPEATDETPLTITFTASAHPAMPADPDLGTIGRVIR